MVEVAAGINAADFVGAPLPFPEPALSVPLGWRTTAAALCVSNQSPDARFDPGVVASLQGFAGQAVLALELAEARHDAERVMVFEDRDRIARDLHDSVIQRLFAAGMQLETIARTASEPAIADRIHTVVDDLDITIRDIRSTIYSLQTVQREDPVGIRARIVSLASQLGSILGFTPQVRIDGPIDALVPESITDDVIAVLRESLSNVAKHAHASKVALAIDVTNQELTLVVSDDGVGLVLPPTGDGEPARRSGLANLEFRARSHGGTFAINTSPDVADGWSTEVRWSVPLHD